MEDVLVIPETSNSNNSMDVNPLTIPKSFFMKESEPKGKSEYDPEEAENDRSRRRERRLFRMEGTIALDTDYDASSDSEEEKSDSIPFEGVSAPPTPQESMDTPSIYSDLSENDWHDPYCQCESNCGGNRY